MTNKPSITLSKDLFFAEVENLLKDQSSVQICVKGNSMLPFIRHNDTVLLTSPSPENVRRGAIVVALTDEIGYVLHRIIKIEGSSITLKGDGNLYQKEHTDRKRVIAVAVRCERGNHTYSTESRTMRFLGSLWMTLHPCCKKFILFFYSKSCLR